MTHLDSEKKEILQTIKYLCKEISTVATFSGVSQYKNKLALVLEKIQIIEYLDQNPLINKLVEAQILENTKLEDILLNQQKNIFEIPKEDKINVEESLETPLEIEVVQKEKKQEVISKTPPEKEYPKEISIEDKLKEVFLEPDTPNILEASKPSLNKTSPKKLASELLKENLPDVVLDFNNMIGFKFKLFKGDGEQLAAFLKKINSTFSEIEAGSLFAQEAEKQKWGKSEENFKDRFWVLIENRYQ